MGGLAALARELGHAVEGSDQNVYPPMSTQLEALGIALKSGYAAEHLQPAPDLVVASDTGASNTDNVTGDATPTFTGTAETGSSVELLDGASVVGIAVASGGIWTITSSPLTTSTHTIRARGTDPAGNVSPLSPALQVTITP